MDLAGKLYREAVERSPSHPVPRANLVMFLIRTGEYEQADKALGDLIKLNHLGRLDAKIAELQSSLDSARGSRLESTQP